MKNKNLVSKLMVAVCVFSFAGTFTGTFKLLGGPDPVTAALAAAAYVATTARFVAENRYAIQDCVLTSIAYNSSEFTALIKNLSEEFATEYEAYRTSGALNKVAGSAANYLWLKNNKEKLVKVAAMAANSNNPVLAHYVVEKLVKELDPVITDGPMRKKLDAAKAYFWLLDHEKELTRVATGETSDFPEKLAKECVTVLSPLVDKNELEKNLNHAKTAFWVRKHKNSLIGAAVVGSVIGLGAAFGAGYYMASGSTAKAA